ncbi:MAG: hypothetical protein AABZ12_00060 [Planctomycetota bacterium]
MKLATAILARTRSSIGLDIGATGVRAVQLVRTGNGFVVETAIAMAGSLSVGGSEKSAMDPRRLSQALARAGFRGTKAAAVLSMPDVTFHVLDLPPVALDQCSATARQIVSSEVVRLTGMSGGEFQAVHWKLPPSQVSGPNAMAVCASRTVVGEILALCRSSGLHCFSVDASPTALARFGAVLDRRPDGCVWGVLDVGERQSRLTLVLEGVPVLVRAVGSGSQVWTQRIAKSFDLSPQAAEVHKRDGGISAAAAEGGLPGVDVPESKLPSLILGAIRGELTDLAAQIKRSYEYVLGCHPDRRAGDLVLCGSGALLRNLAEFLASSLGISVRPASSYLGGAGCRLKLSSSCQEPIERLGAAIGLLVEEDDAAG